MSRYPSPYARTQSVEYAGDSGAVASFMNGVYAWMCGGLGLTAVVAWWVSTQYELVFSKLGMPGAIVMLIGLIALPWIIRGMIDKMSSTVATTLFLVYSALVGMAISSIFLVYEMSSIFLTFGVTAGTFAAMSIVGFVTKKDLTSLGGFLLMALLGLIIASIVNIFMQSPALYWIVTYAGVLIFMGLTAYDTQKLKEMAMVIEGDEEMAARLAIVGALELYLDFVNLFLYLLRILGKLKTE
jgi:uncharacterized protein